MFTKNLINGLKINYLLDNGDTLLNDISFSIEQGAKIGLVGRNGSGKSTLLKIIAGDIKATGSLNLKSTIYYLPQIELDKYKSKQQVYEYISEKYNEWWEVLELLQQHFDFDLNPEALLSTLSGGEIMKINLMIGFVLRPDVFLLDEPTNHLDISSLNLLSKLILRSNKTFVIVSHDPSFLNKTVSTIWEIEEKKLHIYGGNYYDYKKEKRLQLEAKQRSFEAAKKEMNKIKRAMELEEKRESRSIKTGREIADKNDRTIGRMQRDFFKNRAEKAAGKHMLKLEKRAMEFEEDMSKNRINKKRGVYLNLEVNQNRGKELLLNIENTNLKLNDSNTLINSIELKIYYGDRIAILGNNGSGKTCLVKNFKTKPELPIKFDKDIYIKQGIKILFTDQKYDIVDPEKSLLENILSFNTTITYENARKALANLLFLKEEDINKKAKVLSGGEIARLCFAMITCTEIDLLVLDEPTNNLDIETVETITNSLLNFNGALVAISHNQQFLSDIQIEKYFVIQNKHLSNYQ